MPDTTTPSSELVINNLKELNGKINSLELFPTPVHLLMVLDPDFREGRVELNAYQKEFSVQYANPKWTKDNPCEISFCAVNGSGKDCYCIAPAIIWMIFCHSDSYVVTTSSSALQLEMQTENYVRRLARNANEYFGVEVFTIKERQVICNITDSMALLFRSDEEGKTEGHHPRKPGAKFAIIINEAKSVEDKIFEALLRCNGYTHWIEVSSPGKPDGHFFRYHTGTRPTVWRRTVIGDECKHLTAYHFERLKEDLGENSPLYRSMRYAEFTSVEEQVVLGYHQLDRCFNFAPHYIPDRICGGLDLSGGGDETVLVVRNGNKVLGLYASRISDLAAKGKWLSELFDKHAGLGKQFPIYADAGGLGAEIIKYLWSLGYKNILPVFNQSASTNPAIWKNYGTESWFHLAKLIENQVINIDALRNDTLLRKQLCNRYYKFTDKNVAALETKQQARAKGHPSPDRADALVLAFSQFEESFQQKSLATPDANRIKTLREIRFGISEKPSQSNDSTTIRSLVTSKRGDLTATQQIRPEIKFKMFKSVMEEELYYINKTVKEQLQIMRN